MRKIEDFMVGSCPTFCPYLLTLYKVQRSNPEDEDISSTDQGEMGNRCGITGSYPSAFRNTRKVPQNSRGLPLSTELLV